VPVSQQLGNGQDPDKNLYWGAAFGVRTFFRKSPDWILIRQYTPDQVRVERLVFRHKRSGMLLVADAYNGRYIHQATVDFLHSCSGSYKDTLQVNGRTVGINGHAQLLAYVGHDGLMDFRLTEQFRHTDQRQRDVMILACYSKHFFSSYLQQCGARPLLWSTGKMSPEAYTLYDALNAYIRNPEPASLRTAAARAYARYQHCSEKAARGLLQTGW